MTRHSPSESHTTLTRERTSVTFWGVRGSYPVPGPRTVRMGGNTACVEIQAGPHTIILDAGTGIINLGADLVRRARSNGGHPITATILFSHMHNDHTQGFPFFDPAYVGASTLHILGPKVFESDLEETLSHAMLPPSFPSASRLGLFGSTVSPPP